MSEREREERIEYGRNSSSRSERVVCLVEWMNSTGWVCYGFNGASSGGTQLLRGHWVPVGRLWVWVWAWVWGRRGVHMLSTGKCKTNYHNCLQSGNEERQQRKPPRWVDWCLPSLPVALLSWVGPITAALYCIAKQITQLVLINLNWNAFYQPQYK